MSSVVVAIALLCQIQNGIHYPTMVAQFATVQKACQKQLAQCVITRKTFNKEDSEKALLECMVSEGKLK